MSKQNREEYEFLPSKWPVWAAVLFGVAMYGFGKLEDFAKLRDMRLEHKGQYSQLESQKQPFRASLKDINLDGTNELVITDRSGRQTPLFLYDVKTNQYFSAETIREMKARELEDQMRNYTNAEVEK